MPTKRTPEIADEIVRRISEGEPLRQICRDEHIPNWQRVYEWLDEDEEFAGRIARARDLGFDAIAADSLAIIDAPPERIVTMQGDERSESRIDSAAVQWAKNRAEHRLKLLAKWSPKKYGDRMALTDGDGKALAAPTAINIVSVPGALPKPE